MSVASVSSYIKLHEKLIAFLVAVVLVWAVVGKIDRRIEARDNVRLAQDKSVAVAQAQKDAALQSAVIQRDATLVKTQKAVTTLTLPAVGQQLQKSIGGQADIEAEVNGLSINDSGARRLLVQLDSVPVLQADVTDLQNEVGGLRKELADNQQVCKDQIAVVKASERRSKRRWFVAGFVAGIATRILVKF